MTDRCLYGVDINPLAVAMAKLSLWLITLQRDRPFTFLDHALKCGDSLRCSSGSVAAQIAAKFASLINLGHLHPLNGEVAPTCSTSE
ncbi:MAG TPA: hypothetical protein VD994_19385 [Prosthecobacter sp.]|nr:hypothetical protein [Prosthecobacter sp.]